MNTFLLEIGSEEIPARFVTPGLTLLREHLEGLLRKSSIAYEGLSAFATPRRLIIYIEKVAERQDDRTVESVGPPKKAAFNEKGEPTKAAIGFAGSVNVDVSDLKVVQTDRGEYVAAVIHEKGRAAIEVLGEELPNLIASLPLPKSMRWGDGSLRFFRPIRWILALFGNEIIPFEIEGLQSGRHSCGHRFLAPEPFPVDSPPQFPALLKDRFVIANQNEREDIIRQALKEIESERNCLVYEDTELLRTVTDLVEYPVAVAGTFEDKYLALPKELPVTVMRTHQKYFSTQDAKGNLQPTFVIISNTRKENSDTVRKGAEKVLRARLEDARFYFMEDRKLPLQDHAENLKSVTFQEKLGSLHEKTIRIQSLCSFIAKRLGAAESETISRAALLAKADLVTGIVREFPELQGYMGMIYAAHGGEDQQIATAIYEHYLPRYPGDSLPEGMMGTIISLADKMDNISSFFYLGLIPTGSEDPFALRRQATAIITLLQQKNLPLSLRELIDQSIKKLEPSGGSEHALAAKILPFFSQRLEGMFLAQGFSQDLVQAVLSSPEIDARESKGRLETLARLRSDRAFPALLLAAKRVYNILSDRTTAGINESLLKDSSEKELFRTVSRVRQALQEEDYDSLFALTGPINDFFDSVMVMDEDAATRDNRLALLSSVKAAFAHLGDFSRIQE